MELSDVERLSLGRKAVKAISWGRKKIWPPKVEIPTVTIQGGGGLVQAIILNISGASRVPQIGETITIRELGYTATVTQAFTRGTTRTLSMSTPPPEMTPGSILAWNGREWLFQTSGGGG